MLMLACIPQAVPGNSSVWWLMAIVVGFQILVVVILVRDFRKTGRFLALAAEQPAGNA